MVPQQILRANSLGVLLTFPGEGEKIFTIFIETLESKGTVKKFPQNTKLTTVKYATSRGTRDEIFGFSPIGMWRMIILIMS